MDIDIVDKRINRHPWVWSTIGHPTHLFSAATASICELDHYKMVFNRLLLFFNLIQSPTVDGFDSLCSSPKFTEHNISTKGFC